MKPYLLFCALIAWPALAGCNSTKPLGAGALASPTARAEAADKYDYKKLGGVHANHTPEQHAAFLKRVGQLPSSEDGVDAGGLGGGGGGHHH